MRPGTRVPRMVMSGFAAAALAGGLVTSLAFPATAASAAAVSRHGPHVLLVGTFHGVPGKFHSIQAAVNAARPGDWILVAPGDYHENADETGPSGNPAVVGFILARRAFEKYLDTYLCLSVANFGFLKGLCSPGATDERG